MLRLIYKSCPFVDYIVTKHIVKCIFNYNKIDIILIYCLTLSHQQCHTCQQRSLNQHMKLSFQLRFMPYDRRPHLHQDHRYSSLRATQNEKRRVMLVKTMTNHENVLS